MFYVQDKEVFKVLAHIWVVTYSEINLNNYFNVTPIVSDKYV